MSWFQPLYEGSMQAQSQRAQARQYDDQAAVSRQQSSANEDTMRRKTALQMGDLRGAAAESGFDPSSGSLLDMQARSAGELELDVLTERYKRELQSIGYSNEAESLRTSAKNTMKQARVSAFMSMVKDGERVASMGMKG